MFLFHYFKFFLHPTTIFGVFNGLMFWTVYEKFLGLKFCMAVGFNYTIFTLIPHEFRVENFF